jgi:plastocyanin
MVQRRGTAATTALVTALLTGAAGWIALTLRKDDYAKWDPKTNTATLELIAGPFAFNDATNGSAGFVVPSKASVVVNFINKDGTPHSAEVISGEGPVPNQAVDPAIPRAYTNKVQEGLPQEATDVMKFTVPDSGKYRIFCGVPGHGVSGMWIWLTVDPAAKTASFGKQGTGKEKQGKGEQGTTKQ